MSGTETRPTEGLTPSKEGPSYYGGKAEASVHDRTGLLVAIIALAATAFFSAVAVMGYMANRDENIRLRSELIELETKLQDLQIQFDEFKDRK